MVKFLVKLVGLAFVILVIGVVIWLGMEFLQTGFGDAEQAGRDAIERLNLGD